MVPGPASSVRGRRSAVGSADIALRPHLILRSSFQIAEAVFPHPSQVVADLAEGLAVGGEEVSRAFAALVHEARLLQDAEVLRDGRTGDVEMRCDFTTRTFAVPHQPEDLAAARLSNRLDR